MFDFLRKVRSSMTGESNEEVLQEVSQEGQIEGKEIESTIVDEATIQEGLAPSEKADIRPRNIDGFPYEEFPGCQPNTRTKLIDRTDYPAQIYPWMLDCSCGFQARLYTKNEALAVGERHLGRRMEAEA